MSLPARKKDDGGPPARPQSERKEGIMQRIKQPALRVDGELLDTLSDAQRGQWSVIVQPPEQSDGDLIDSAEQLWQSLHEELDRLSYELHRTEEGAIEFHFVCQSKPAARRTQRHILSNYPRAACEVERSRLPIEAGDAVAAARVEYEQDHLLPLISQESHHAPDGDPSRSVLETLANEHGRCVVQTVVEPVDRGWTTRWSRGTALRREDHRWWRLPPDRHSRMDAIPEALALTLLVGAGWWAVGQWFAGLTSGVLPLFIGLGLVCCGFWWSTLFGHPFPPVRQSSSDVARHLRDKPWSEDKPTRGERKAADLIDQQGRAKSFRVSMRLVAIDDTSSGAHDYLDAVGTQLTSAYHNRSTTQQLTHVPIARPQRRINNVVERLAQRAQAPKRWRARLDSALSRSHRPQPMLMPDFELAGMLGHLPDKDSGGEGAVDYAPPRLSARVPPAAGRYDRPEEMAQDLEENRPRNSPIARAGRLLAGRLPSPLAARIGERLPVRTVSSDARPSWLPDDDDLAVDIDHRETAMHKRYGEVETMMIDEGDPNDPDDEDDVYMGEFYRELIASKQERPRDDVWIGSQQHGETIREVGIPFETLFTHIFVQGATGQGKSTLAAAILAQWANSGYGFCLPDPSGELVREVRRFLPEHRKDDVVHFDPEPEEAKKIVGLNLLEVEAEPTADNYDAVVDSAIDDIVGVVKDEDYWGRRMDGVVRNLSRVMITSPEAFTFVDLHEALTSEEGREELAAKAGKDDEFVARYTRKIAEMDDGDLDALIRRINGWVESKVARQVISHQDSTISIKEAIEQRKIILIDNDVSKDSIQRLIGVGVWRRVWRWCRERPEGERVPYALLADEFDDFLSDEMDVDEQVRNARKYRLCLILMTQYLEALGNGDVETAIDEECTTVISFRIKSRDGAGSVAKMHGLDEREYLTKLERFHAIIEIEVERKPRGPFEISILPPVAPQRTDAEADEEIVEPALDRDGTDLLTDQEIREQAIIGNDDAAIEDEQAIAQRNATALKAIEDTAIRQGSPGDFVALSDCVARLNDYLGESFRNADDAWRNGLQNVPETQLAERQPDGTHEVKVTDRAWLGVGEDVTSGGREHALIMEDAYQPLMQLGFVVDVLDQSDGAASESMPDALAKPDDALDLDGLDPVDDAGEIADRVNEFRTSDDHSQIVRLTGVRDGYIEAEHSTSGTQPSQAVRNAIEAHNDDRRCLYLIRPELASKLHGYLEAPAGCRSDHDTHGETRFYTKTGALTINGGDMTRPGTSENVWIRDEDTGQIVLRDDSGTEHARFDSAYEVFNDKTAYPEGGDRTVTPPLIPDHELDERTMEDVEWDIIVVPHPEIDETDERQRLTPLDLKLYQPIGNNVPVIDLPVSPSEREAVSEDETDMQAVHDALDDAANMFEE